MWWKLLPPARLTRSHSSSFFTTLRSSTHLLWPRNSSRSQSGNHSWQRRGERERRVEGSGEGGRRAAASGWRGGGRQQQRHAHQLRVSGHAPRHPTQGAGRCGAGGAPQPPQPPRPTAHLARLPSAHLDAVGLIVLLGLVLAQLRLLLVLCIRRQRRGRAGGGSGAAAGHARACKAAEQSRGGRLCGCGTCSSSAISGSPVFSVRAGWRATGAGRAERESGGVSTGRCVSARAAGALAPLPGARIACSRTDGTLWRRRGAAGALQAVMAAASPPLGRLQAQALAGPLLPGDPTIGAIPHSPEATPARASSARRQTAFDAILDLARALPGGGWVWQGCPRARGIYGMQWRKGALGNDLDRPPTARLTPDRP